ncbi:extracellular solute-binding protein [Brachybacterium sp. FME24]|uniref:extracellular solute-binding protein n=1 Tax=Brachybacterium sp. FME24 TaxID=2742605 RepID=UPI0027150179|nr:extracellular solute-binding protein [Brachybacterium sp. FME24]
MDQKHRTIAPALDRRSLLRSGAYAALAVPALGALASCGDGGGGGEAGDGTGELKLLYMGDATQQETFQTLFDSFQESHPDITVNASGIASGDWATFGNTVATRIAGGERADIISVATEGQRLMSSKGLFEPLDDLIERDHDETQDFYDNISPRLGEWLDTYGSPDGSTYFVPGGYNTVVMYLNRQVFEDAGVQIPDTDWTWDEFRTVAETIKEETGAFITTAGAGFPFGQILPWLFSNGASTLSEDWATATFNSPEAIEAAEFVKGLVDDELVPQPGGEFDGATQYQRGSLASLTGGRYTLPDVRRLEMVEQTKIVNFPHKAGPGTPIGWDGWSIFQASPNKEAAWTFLKWLMTIEASEYYAEQGGTNVPVREDVASSEAFLGNAPEGTELIATAIEFATPVPSPDQQAQVDVEVNKGWEAAILGNQPVEEALNAANEAMQGLL